MRYSPLFVLSILLSGCGTIGVHWYGSWVSYEVVEFQKSGQFRYELWSDDGGAVCFAIGLWRRLPDGSIETIVDTWMPGTRDSCPSLRRVERWSMSGGRLFRGSQGPYKRTNAETFSDHAPWTIE